MPSPRLAALALLTAGAATVSTAIAVPAGAATTGRAPIRVHLDRAHTVVAPDTVHPGRAKLHNSGSGSIVAVEPLNGATATDLKNDISKQRFDKLFHDFAVLGELRAHKSLFVRLHRGTVYFVNSSSKNPQVTAMHVRGAAQNVAIPASSPVLFAEGGALSAPATLPTRGLLAITNRTHGAFGLFLVRVGSSVSQQAIDDFVAHPKMSDIGDLDPTDFRAFGPVAAAHRVWVPYWVGTGRWVVLGLSLTKPLVDADSFVVR